MTLDIYKGLWCTLFGPDSTTSTNPDNPLVINSDGSINVVAAVTIAGNTGVDGSSTITSGGTAQNLFAGATPTNGCAIYNPDPTEDLWISLSTTAAANAVGAIRLAANGGGYETPGGMKPFHAISIIGATTGHKFTAVKW